MSVQKLRLQRGWSQEQLAELSGVSARTIQRIERGQSASMETLKALAAVFEIDFSELRSPSMTDAATINAAASGRPLFGQTPLTHQEALAFAKVRKIRKFYLHLAVYCVVALGLAAMLLIERGGLQPWWFYMASAWGLGLLLQGLLTFGAIPIFGAAWERRQVEKILGRKL
jgi:transcriptional regulator with XRE-family HTH domain